MMPGMVRRCRIHRLALGLLATGCAGGEVVSVSSDLTRLQREKVSLESQIQSLKGSARDGAVVQLANLEGELERVADVAYANTKTFSNIKAKISNYRIAATADWQRGDHRAVTIAREGTDLCNSSIGYDVAPRDCVILLIVPDLLVNDIMVARFEQARSETQRGLAGVPGRYRSAVNDLLNSYVGLERAAARAADTSVSPLMIDVLQSRRGSVARNIDRYVDLFITRGRPEDMAENAAICAGIRRDAPAILPRRCNSL
jgi:hypothetical protein